MRCDFYMLPLARRRGQSFYGSATGLDRIQPHPPVHLRCEDQAIIRRPVQRIRPDNSRVRVVQRISAPPYIARFSGVYFGDPDRPWIGRILGEQSRLIPARGLADERDTLAVQRPSRRAVAVDRG